MNPVIYKIEFPSGKSYIGSTVNFRDRRTTHLHHGRKGKAVNRLLQSEFDAHPVCGIYVVASGLDRATLHELEAQVIAQHKPELNVHLVPTPLPTVEQSSAKPFGPYPSIKNAAKAMKVPYQTLKRYAWTMTHDEVLQKLRTLPATKRAAKIGPPDPRGLTKLVNLGSGWDVRSELKSRYGVTDKAYESRVSAGWSTREALTTPIGVVRGSRPSVSRKSICIKYGVLDITYKDRRVRGWTLLQALGAAPPPTPPKRKPVKKRYITAAGQTKSLDDWTALTGLKKSCICSRITSGCTPEQALGLEKTPRQAKADANLVRVKAKPKRPTFTVKGFTGTIMEIAAHFLVADSVIRGRQRMGWPEDDWVKPKAGFRDEYVELLGEFMDEV